MAAKDVERWLESGLSEDEKKEAATAEETCPLDAAFIPLLDRQSLPIGREERPAYQDTNFEGSPGERGAYQDEALKGRMLTESASRRLEGITDVDSRPYFARKGGCQGSTDPLQKQGL